MEPDRTTLSVGQSTTIRVYGQIDPAIAAGANQIFSWYIDIVNDGGGVVRGYTNVRTPTSDNTPNTSSDGTIEGANLKGIYDTFLLAPGVGKTTRVLLVEFQVTAQTPGAATFTAQAGSTGKSLSDFLVSKIGGGAYTGGNYTAASAKISVTEGVVLPVTVRLGISVSNSVAAITFIPNPQYNHFIQYSDFLQLPNWTNLPGSPHNTGVGTDSVINVRSRFYRLMLTPR